MELGSLIKKAFGKLSELRNIRLHVLLLSTFFLPILLILFLDFFNIEAFGSLNQEFMFNLTWKGRMFYLFFVWLILLESVLDWEVVVEEQRMLQNRFRIFLLLVFGAVPTIYILSVNFLGLDQMIFSFGEFLQIRPEFIDSGWPLSVEYVILALFFILATWLAYGLAGVKGFSISLSLLAGIGIVYLVDTIWPYGTLKPMQLLAVPTSAFATALLDLLGYSVALTYPFSSPEYGSMPLMTVRAAGETVRANIAWPCAGVHSLLLFTLIALVFFKKTAMRRETKIVFFLVGAVGTYLTNILRIASYFAISIHYGSEAGLVFHNSYGELCFVLWIFAYFIIVTAVMSGKISRFTQAFRKKLGALRIRIHS